MQGPTGENGLPGPKVNSFTKLLLLTIFFILVCSNFLDNSCFQIWFSSTYTYDIIRPYLPCWDVITVNQIEREEQQPHSISFDVFSSIFTFSWLEAFHLIFYFVIYPALIGDNFNVLQLCFYLICVFKYQSIIMPSCFVYSFRE